MSDDIMQTAVYTPLWMVNSGFLEYIVKLAVDMLSHPKKYFEYRLQKIETKLIALTCIVQEDCIRP